MDYFDKKAFNNFLKWIQKIKKEEICDGFIDEENTIDDILFIFNINGVQEEYYNIIFKNFNKIKENILYTLQNKLELIDDKLNINFKKEVDYPDNTLYFIDIYIENKKTGLKILYGTYYSDGFEEKYEILNESY